MLTCRNCGVRSDGPYCPLCGQLLAACKCPPQPCQVCRGVQYPGPNLVVWFCVTCDMASESCICAP